MEVPAWALMVLAGIFTGLIGLVWRDLVKRIDGIASKLDTHVVEDVTAHERVTRLETQVEINTKQIQTNYDKFHRFQIEIREWQTKHYQWCVEKFEGLYRWITEKVIEALRKP